MILDEEGEGGTVGNRSSDADLEEDRDQKIRSWSGRCGCAQPEAAALRIQGCRMVGSDQRVAVGSRSLRFWTLHLQGRCGGGGGGGCG